MRAPGCSWLAAQAADAPAHGMQRLLGETLFGRRPRFVKSVSINTSASCPEGCDLARDRYHQDPQAITASDMPVPESLADIDEHFESRSKPPELHPRVHALVVRSATYASSAAGLEFATS
jgi:hypothetical protein